jgi:hypothetical protein
MLEKMMLTIDDIEICEDCEEYGEDCNCDDDFDWENHWDEYGDYLYERQKDARDEQ